MNNKEKFIQWMINNSGKKSTINKYAIYRKCLKI